MKTFRNHLEKKLKSKEFARAYKYERDLLALALKINEARSNSGLSQAELARKARITQQQLSKIENGENCNLLTFIKVSRALNLDLEIVNSAETRSRQ